MSKTINIRWLGGLSLCAALGLFFVAAGAGQAVEPPALNEVVSPGGPAMMRRLSEDEYKRSIEHIFGADITVPGRFEPPVREDGLLAIGDSHVIVTPAGFEQYAIRAREISHQVLDEKHRATFLKCAPANAATFDEPCATQFLSKYGRLLVRRPLSREELASTVGLSRDVAAKTGDFHKGVEAGLGSLLLSPSFVFRIETTEPDPAHKNSVRLDGYSVATRISFLLWDAPPDEALLDAAASGALHDPARLGVQVDRLMASPHLEQGVRAYFFDMLAFDQFAGLSKDSALFPVFNPQLRKDGQEQAMRTIIDHLLTLNNDYRDLFLTKKTFLSRSLGALYGVPVDASAFGGWMPYTFPEDDPHSGLLTFAGFLMLDASHEGRSSPTIRGKSVRENLLCQPVPAPPADVNFDLVQDVNDPVHKTARERLTAHQDNPVCAGCHRITDPIGLSLENFTPVGTYRTHENGELIDASGKFEGKDYSDAKELMKLLHDSPALTSCLVQRVYEYGVGRKAVDNEEQWIEALNADFAKGGFRLRGLLRAVATSQAFQAVSITPPPSKTASR